MRERKAGFQKAQNIGHRYKLKVGGDDKRITFKRKCHTPFPVSISREVKKKKKHKSLEKYRLISTNTRYHLALSTVISIGGYSKIKAWVEPNIICGQYDIHDKNLLDQSIDVNVLLIFKGIETRAILNYNEITCIILFLKVD